MATNLELVQRVRDVLEQTRARINRLLELEARLLEHDRQEIARDARAQRVNELRDEMQATGVDDRGWNGGRT